MKQLKLIWLWAALSVFSFGTVADSLQLNPDVPEVYIVKKGDTLWDISELYLKSPWLWPRLWQNNDHIENPHLIYPGDQLSLIWVDGEPRLVRKRIVKLGPKVHTQEKQQAIPTLDLASIYPFLVHDHVIDPADLKDSPYVLGDNDAQTRIAQGRSMYAQGNLLENRYYGVYRVGKQYRDVVTNELLGHTIQLSAIALAEKNHPDDITQFKVAQLKQEIRQGDILLPLPDKERLPVHFTPKPKELDERGYIIGSATNDSVFSHFDVVIINQGERDAISPGDMFAIAQPGQAVIDKKKSIAYADDASAYDRVFNKKRKQVLLPDEKVGELMVFKVYDKMSFAIITESKVILEPRFIVESL